MSESDGNDSFSSAVETIPANITFPLSKTEIESLERKLNRIVVIQQADSNYHKALGDIKDQASISLVVEPSFYGRHQPTSILAVATSSESYVFDIKALGSIFPEMARILEADKPRKVVHYSHRIADHLIHKHGISLGGICDSFVALCLARQDKTPCSLPKAISLVFALPMEDILCGEVIGASESRRNFTARPLTSSQLRYLARMVQLQHTMLDRLIYGSICAEVQRMSMEFSQNFLTNRSSDVAMKMAPGSRFGFHLIDPCCEIANEGISLPTPKEIERHETEHQKGRK
ncbi:protein Exd1 homolog [Drosophila ficusphila]|uniref:protein Exd1 homolog n=1 Tax=Drosophila ficusphila TaxID=30025 RepID=UPI0007E61AD9|nr:protein Exd1 homolog [Drosophila ficusphila]XP_017052074.1 protein Exd1 homolog [Drosophila ficusphila]